MAKNELDMLLQDESLMKRDVPILFFANKMDLGEAMTTLEVSEQMELDHITDRTWNIQGCSAKTGKGVEDGMNWVSSIVE